MAFPPFVLEVAAGVISGAVVTSLPLLRKSALPPGSNISVSGNRNTTVLDQSRHHHWEITQHTTTQTVTAAPNGSGHSDSEEVLVLTGIAVVIAFFGFLFAWPLALGLLLGTCLGTSIVYSRAASSVALRSVGFRGKSTAHCLMTLTFTAITCGFVVFAADGQGVVNVEREISTHFPGYSTSIPIRWSVLTDHSAEVYKLIGLDGALTLIFQIAGLLMCATITAVLAMRTIGAVALCQQTTGRKIGRLRQTLGTRLLTEPTSTDLVVTLLLGTVAVFLASGLAARVINMLATPTIPSKMYWYHIGRLTVRSHEPRYGASGMAHQIGRKRSRITRRTTKAQAVCVAAALPRPIRCPTRWNSCGRPDRVPQLRRHSTAYHRCAGRIAHG